MINYSPLRYPGGKNKTYNYLKYLVKSNGIKTYIEPYCGGAAVALKLLINEDVENIIINDYDPSIYAMWYTILNDTEELISKIEGTKFSIEEWEHQKSIQKNKNEQSISELGYSTLYLNRTNRSGILTAGPIGGLNQTGKYKIDCRFNKETIIKKIELIASKKDKIKLYNKDAIELIKKDISNLSNSLTFFDPPYFTKGKDLYTNFYQKSDHIELSNVIKQYMNNKKWILTYDVHDEIKDLYRDFEYVIYQLNYSVGKSKKGKEFMFFSKNLSTEEIDKFLSVASI